MGKIIVIGDSIVYGKWDSDGGWVIRLRKWIDEKYNLYKGGNFQVHQLGIPGEVAIRQVERFEQELTSRLTQDDDKYVVLIAVGVNDSCPNNWMTNTQTPKDQYKQAFNAMIDIALKHNCKVGVIGLTPVNPERPQSLLFTNEEVKKYDMYIQEVCTERKIPKLDVFDILHNQDFPDLLVDIVHPNNEGHEIIFQHVLEFLERNKFLEYLTGEDN